MGIEEQKLLAIAIGVVFCIVAAVIVFLSPNAHMMPPGPVPPKKTD